MRIQRSMLPSTLIRAFLNTTSWFLGLSPAIFQSTIGTLLQGIPHVAVCLDDILVTGATEVEHLANLERLFKRLSEARLRLKWSKCVFMVPSVTCLGHKITAEGLCPLEDKMEAIKEAPSRKLLFVSSDHFWAWSIIMASFFLNSSKF